MKKIFTSALWLASSFFASYAQTTDMANYITGCGGVYEFSSPYQDRASIGVYNDVANNYRVFDTIQVESVQDVKVDGNYAYLAAQDSIIKYDLSTLTRIAAVYFPAVYKMTVADSLLIVSKFYGSAPFLYVLDKNNLNILFSVNEVDQNFRRAALVGDTLYVPNNIQGTIDQYPPWGIYKDTLGRIAVIDVPNQSFVRYIELDTMGAGIKSLYHKNGVLYGAGVEHGFMIEHQINSNNTNYISNISFKSLFAEKGDIIYGITNSGIKGYSVSGSMLINSGNDLVSNDSIVAANLDTLNNRFVCSFTDYSSYGSVIVYDYQGSQIASYNTGVSPEGIDIYYGPENLVTVNTKEVLSAVQKPVVYPNPAGQDLYIEAYQSGVVYIFDVSGKIVYQKSIEQGINHIDVSSLQNGLYFLKANGATVKIIKQ